MVTSLLPKSPADANKNSRLFEIVPVLARFDPLARRIINANHGIM
jgi:hypothetical protein